MVKYVSSFGDRILSVMGYVKRENIVTRWSRGFEVNGIEAGSNYTLAEPVR